MYGDGEAYSVSPASAKKEDAGLIQVRELGQNPNGAPVTLGQAINIVKRPSGEFLFHVLDHGTPKDLTCDIEILDHHLINMEMEQN